MEQSYVVSEGHIDKVIELAGEKYYSDGIIFSCDYCGCHILNDVIADETEFDEVALVRFYSENPHNVLRKLCPQCWDEVTLAELVNYQEHIEDKSEAGSEEVDWSKDGF